MNYWTNGSAGQPWESSEEVLTRLASHLDRQLVVELGGEFLAGSGFEEETPERDFGPEEESNA